MPEIIVKLTDASIDAAIAKLEQYKKDLDNKMKQVISQLTQCGLAVMRSGYTMAAYPGTNDVSVNCEFFGNTCYIKASGKTLAFIEFGTGINNPMGVYGDKAGALPHGTYGRGLGANPKGWIYEGSAGQGGLAIPVRDSKGRKKDGVWRTKGNPPANVFPKTIEEIQNNVQTIVRSVF